MRGDQLLVLAATLALGPGGTLSGALSAHAAPHPHGSPTSGLTLPGPFSPQRERWRALVRIVFAEDERGLARHPTLRRLWERVATSGHRVRIELTDDLSATGRFLVEGWDERGEQHVAVIQLNLERVDRGLAKPAAGHADGFVPFLGLSREQRYAEVLGHELAHAVWDLATPTRARLGLELREGQARLTQALRDGYRPGQPVSPAIRRWMSHLDELRRSLERPAKALEAAVWEELAGRCQPSGRERLVASGVGPLWPPIRGDGMPDTAVVAAAAAGPGRTPTSGAFPVGGDGTGEGLHEPLP